MNTLAQSIIEEDMNKTTNQTGKKSKSDNPSKRINKQKLLFKLLSYLLLLVITCITIVPFLFALSTSLKGTNDVLFSIPPQLIPKNITFDNFITVWNTLPIARYLMNSVILTFLG